jgi:pyrimidine dimer DNA glycosylase
VRLWTLHPRYLDARGLVALWREGLLARAVLKGKTRGYRHHPQLARFRAHAAPRTAINAYLRIVAAEAAARGYCFDLRKLGPRRGGLKLTTTRGQLRYEWQHLLRKLASRSPRMYQRWSREKAPRPHPLFRVVRGGVEPWERRGKSGARRA